VSSFLLNPTPRPTPSAIAASTAHATTTPWFFKNRLELAMAFVYDGSRCVTHAKETERKFRYRARRVLSRVRRRVPRARHTRRGEGGRTTISGGVANPELVSKNGIFLLMYVQVASAWSNRPESVKSRLSTSPRTSTSRHCFVNGQH